MVCDAGAVARRLLPHGRDELLQNEPRPGPERRDQWAGAVSERPLAHQLVGTVEPEGTTAATTQQGQGPGFQGSAIEGTTTAGPTKAGPGKTRAAEAGKTKAGRAKEEGRGTEEEGGGTESRRPAEEGWRREAGPARFTGSAEGGR